MDRISAQSANKEREDPPRRILWNRVQDCILSHNEDNDYSAIAFNRTGPMTRILFILDDIWEDALQTWQLSWSQTRDAASGALHSVLFFTLSRSQKPVSEKMSHIDRSYSEGQKLQASIALPKKTPNTTFQLQNKLKPEYIPALLLSPPCPGYPQDVTCPHKRKL